MDPKLLSLFGKGKDVVKDLRSLLNYFKLGLRRKQLKKNKVKYLAGYNIVDKDIWAWIK